jgi:DNA-binding NarL/FixJ family response regulator
MSIQRSILVVEDDPLLRSLLASKLAADGFMVATAANAAEAKTQAKKVDPDLAVLDIELGDGPNGLELSQMLSAMNQGIAFVFLTNLPEPKLIGLDSKKIPKSAAYLQKGRMLDPKLLSEAIEAALREKVGSEFRHDKTAKHQFSALSRSQLEVMRLLASGLSPNQIAEQRGTTVRAVRNLLARALQAAGLSENLEGNARAIAIREYLKVAGTGQVEPKSRSN